MTQQARISRQGLERRSPAVGDCLTLALAGLGWAVAVRESVGKQNNTAKASESLTLLSCINDQPSTSIIPAADTNHVCPRGSSAIYRLGTAWHQLCYLEPTGQGRLCHLLQG